MTIGFPDGETEAAAFAAPPLLPAPGLLVAAGPVLVWLLLPQAASVRAATAASAIEPSALLLRAVLSIDISFPRCDRNCCEAIIRLRPAVRAGPPLLLQFRSAADSLST